MGTVTSRIEDWEAAVAELWARVDALGREEAVEQMRALADLCPATDGRAAFELAGMYDSHGFEAEAGVAYERALALGLDEARHAQLAVQYGSTLRNLGRVDQAIAVLQAAPQHASTGAAPQMMLALALHSAGRKDEALRVALEAQIDGLPQYQRSMRAYAAALTAPTTLVIDGARIDGIEGLYAQLNALLMAAEDWELGASLDALNDVLYRFSGTGDAGPAVFVWTEHAHSRESLGLDATRQWLEDKLQRPDVFDTAAIRAQRDALLAGEGKTYFDLVMEVFAGHAPDVQLELR